jgi:putative DNA primase/helicase
MKTTELIKLHEHDILKRYGFEITGNRHIDCPICGARKKFRIHTSLGYISYVCVCSNGGLTKLLLETTGKPFKVLADEIDLFYGNMVDCVDSTPEYKKIADRFIKMDNIVFTNVERYLNGRGISHIPERGVKRTISKHYESGLELETMYALAVDNNDKPIYEHYTFLDGNKKANVDPVRKLKTISNYTGSCAVRLYSHKGTLGIAEGVETACSASQIFNTPTWATLNTSIMKKFRAPKGVYNLIIYADNDSHGAGLSVAFECGHRNILSNNDVNDVEIKWTSAGDWNDYLFRQGEIYNWKLNR